MLIDVATAVGMEQPVIAPVFTPKIAENLPRFKLKNSKRINRISSIKKFIKLKSQILRRKVVTNNKHCPKG